MTHPTPELPDADKFRDPLENYEPPTFADPLEEALAEQTVQAIESTPYVSIPPSMPIGEALRTLAKMQVACLLVEENGELLGVFTDRNVLDKVALEYEQLKDHPVHEVMTAEPMVVYETDCAAAALSVMAVSGFRHVPVINLHRQLVSIVSPQRVTAFLCQYFA